ncbi:MAG: crotonase/enoyl-CoA hydratase family protein [Gammaproteobacteria bacterium]|nr:MAG: crotonase/enoyl-CoA hydratase family protein [Gammaproteobacteria bacterium]
MSICIERDGPVTTIVIDRPEHKNAVDPETARKLHTAFVRFERDADARVAVLTGAEDAFCAGFDLKALATGQRDWLSELHFVDDPRDPPLGPMGPSRLSLSKPVIAAVNGAAVAGGMELALWCDFRVMEEQAFMGVFCRRWGVPLVDGGTVRLPRVVGLGRAMELILTGRKVEAEECQRIGLCEYVVASGQARDTAESLGQKIARFPNHCMLADRRSVLAQQGLSVSDALQVEYRTGIPAIGAEGIAGAGRFAAGLGRHGDFEEI